MTGCKTPEFEVESDPRGRVFFDEVIDWREEPGRVRRFRAENNEAITPDAVRDLLAEGYIRKEDRHNDSFTVGELLRFADEHRDQITVFWEGFIVSPERSDCRIAFDAFVVHPVGNRIPDNVLAELQDEFGDATESEIRAEHCSFWWD